MTVKKIKPTQEHVTLELDVPKEYIGREVTVQLLCDDLSEDKEQRRGEIEKIFGKYNVDLSGFKFNREELYDRDLP
jgi:hypothetical protein